MGARVRLEPNLGLILNKGYEGQLKVYTIPQLFLRLRLVKRSVITLDRPGPRFLKVETSLNSCLRSGVAAGISLAILRIKTPRCVSSVRSSLDTNDSRSNCLKDSQGQELLYVWGVAPPEGVV